MNKLNSTIVAFNKRIYYDYFVIKEIEAGLALQGWEVKSVRSNKANINNSYVILKDGEAFLLGSNFMPIIVTSTHYACNPIRTRKLLLNQYELNSLYGYVKRKGHTIVAISLFWKKAWCKIKIGIAKGKRQYDKRSDIKKYEWQLNKARICKITKY